MLTILGPAESNYVAWLIPTNSTWLPEGVRKILTRGMAEWGVWGSYQGDATSAEHCFEETGVTWEFINQLLTAKTHDGILINDIARKDLVHRLDFSSRPLALPEDVEALAQEIHNPGFLEPYFEHRALKQRTATRSS